MKKLIFLVFIAACFLTMGGASLASPAVGSRVRVEHEGQQTTGMLTSIDADSLGVDSEGQALTIPRADVTKIEVSTGRKSHTMTGALVGAATGVLVGVIAVAVEDTDPNDAGEVIIDDTLGAAAILALGVLGGLTGALVGHFIKSDRWTEIPLSGATLGIAPLRNGDIQVAVAWKRGFECAFLINGPSVTVLAYAQPCWWVKNGNWLSYQPI